MYGGSWSAAGIAYANTEELISEAFVDVLANPQT